MNLETINKWLNEEYGCSYTRLEELHDFYFEKYCDLQQENKQLKKINKEYERLDNGKPRGFIITRVDEYNIYDLLSYKENWNKLKMWLNSFHRLSAFEQWEIVNKMQELEQRK